MIAEQLNLADALTDDAIRRVKENADPDWLDEARAFVRAVAQTREKFTTDDLWELGLRQPREPRALGAVMREASRRGICTATTEYTTSIRPECHNRPLRVWRSLLRGAEWQRSSHSQ